MIRKCCLDDSCAKIKPTAYSGSPLHKIGSVPTGAPGKFEDAFANSGEIYSISYSDRKDNIFSYGVTGDNTNVYHSCGTDGIHVYPLADFYQNGNLSSRWKIGSSVEEGVDAAIRTFNYSEEGQGYKLTGVLNTSEGGSTSYRYGYEPSPFSGFYDCAVGGSYLVAARGSRGVSIYGLNSDKTSATIINTVNVPGICKNINCAKVGSALMVFVGCARYEKPSVRAEVTSDGYDIPSAPDKDFSNPQELASLAVLGGWSQAEYEYASVAGYSSENTDGFSSMSSMGKIELHCIVFDIKGERWVLKEAKEKEKGLSLSFPDLLSDKISAGVSGPGEVSGITFSRGETTKDEGNTTYNILVNYGTSQEHAATGFPVGVEEEYVFSLTKKKAQNEAGHDVSVFSISSALSATYGGSRAILDIEKWGGAKFSSSYFDGSHGTQPAGQEGFIRIEDALGVAQYNLRAMDYDYQTSYGWIYTSYLLYEDFKIDVYDCLLTRGKMAVSAYEGGLLMACLVEGESILDWTHFDSHSSFQGGNTFRRAVSTLGNGVPSSLSIIDSWSDGKTIFSVDCVQSSIMGGPRRLGLYYHPSTRAGDGSPEVHDERRSYLYRTKDGKGVGGGGLIAFSVGG